MKNQQLKNTPSCKAVLALSITAVLLTACSKEQMVSSDMAETSANVASVEAITVNSTAKMVSPAP